MFFLMGGVLLSSMASPTACAHLDREVIRSMAIAVENASDQPQLTDTLGSFGAYWASICSDERAMAKPAVVKDLGRLLRVRQARFMIASMLFDVGPNLQFAISDIRMALADQVKIDKKNRVASRPFVPTSDGFIENSLRCLKKKIRKGNIDQELCQFMINSRIR